MLVTATGTTAPFSAMSGDVMVMSFESAGVPPSAFNASSIVFNSKAEVSASAQAWRVVNSPEETAALAWTYATAVEVYGLATAAQTDRIAAQTAANAIAAQSPVANAAAAAASAAAAAVSATLAQATNPDSPIRLNPREINANVNIGSDYNAASVGPIVIAEGITVTINNNATWSIH